MNNPLNKVNDIFEELNIVLSRYNLKIDDAVMQFKRPIEIVITVKEKDL